MSYASYRRHAPDTAPCSAITLGLALVLLAFLLANSGVIVSEFIGIAAALRIFHVPPWISAPVAGFLLWWLVVKGSYGRVEKIFLALNYRFNHLIYCLPPMLDIP